MKNFRQIADSDLPSRCSAGEPECMDELIARHGNKVMAYIVSRVGQADVAKDIYQEAFLKIYMSVLTGRYVHSGRFVQWAVRIAHNLIMDMYRRRRTAYEQPLSDRESLGVFEACVEHNDIESQLVERQRATDVCAMLSHLPLEQREVVEMRHFRDMSFREIAEETNVSINTALGRMRYGLINLRRMAQQL